MSNPIKRSNIHRGDGRLDHQLSTKDTLFFRYSVDWSGHDDSGHLRSRTSAATKRASPATTTCSGRNMVGAWTHTFSPALIGDFRYGYTQFNMALLPTTLTNPLWTTIPGRRHERSLPAFGADRRHHRLCGSRQRPVHAADPRSEDALSHRGHLVDEESTTTQVRRRFAPAHDRRDGQPSRRERLRTLGVRSGLHHGILPRPAAPARPSRRCCWAIRSPSGATSFSPGTATCTRTR